MENVNVLHILTYCEAEKLLEQVDNLHLNSPNVLQSRDWSPKFETGLNIIIGLVQKVEE